MVVQRSSFRRGNSCCEELKKEVDNRLKVVADWKLPAGQKKKKLPGTALEKNESLKKVVDRENGFEYSPASVATKRR